MLLELFKMEKEDKNFQIGDVVNLKSAPELAMTVENVQVQEKYDVCCIYFNNITHEFVRVNVPPATLVLVDQDSLPF